MKEDVGIIKNNPNIEFMRYQDIIDFLENKIMFKVPKNIKEVESELIKIVQRSFPEIDVDLSLSIDNLVKQKH